MDFDPIDAAERHTITGSGPSTIVGDKVGLDDDPFNGRYNAFTDQPAGRKSMVSVNALEDS